MQVRTVNRQLNDYRKIETLFKAAFPKNERIPFWRLLLLSKSKDVHFRAFYENDNFCGFSYTIESETMIFLLYLAVIPQSRSKGYGTKILSWLHNTNEGKEIVLDVERPDERADNNSQRISRIAFYKRNGFTVSNWLISIAGEDYNILSSQKEIDIHTLQKLIKKYHIGTIKTL